jgi:release factor H-coupled RctB family protein
VNLRIEIITNDKNWLEDEAIRQVKIVAAYPDVRAVVAMPDLHPGRTPVGVAVLTEGVVYPHLIGNDIGCGMGLYSFAAEAHKLKQDKLARGAENMLAERPPDDSGTIGGGNHFAEIQRIEKIYAQDTAQKYALRKGSAFLLVHSGSRAYGSEVYSQALAKDGLMKGYRPAAPDFGGYMQKHDAALRKAVQNRDKIAERLAACCGVKDAPRKICESVHNHIAVWPDGCFLHRKGAADATGALLAIAGDRDSLSYLVSPLPGAAETFYTLAHGAGRRWNRTLCKARLENRYGADSIVTRKYRNRLVYRDKGCIYEEAPECYKSIDTVIDVLQGRGLLSVVAVFRPVLTVKG